VALGVCAVTVVALPRLPALFVRLILAAPWRWFVAACVVAAAATSWWTVRSLLRDTPLSIDAAVYLAQARAMSHFHFGVPVPRPMQAFSGHFFSAGPDGLLYGVFPPGWPVVIVPFLWLGRPMLVGPAVAALIVLAQARLGRSMALAGGEGEESEVALRASLLVALFSVGRALETADLLSHAWVALLAAVAMTIALDARREGALTGARAAALGACVAWVVASRLLDGALLGVAVAIVAARAVTLRSAALAAAGAAPFVALLAIEQRCATGSWLWPTQSSYFARSDWPPGCHRLGLGVDIGCTVEHRGIVARYGPAGYDVHQALQVVRERAGKIGEDLVSLPVLLMLSFVPVICAASVPDAVLVAFVLGFTLAYGFFYYGNSQFFGARHLFPLAPFFWVLAARGAARLPHRRAGARWLGPAHARDAGVTVLVAGSLLAARGPWTAWRHEAFEYQDQRSDLRRTLAAEGPERAILKSRDEIAVAAAIDPWRDGNDRFFVNDDGSGLLELRRAHPDWPVLLSLPYDQVGRLYAHPVPPGVLVELERTWPTFVRPHGLGASLAWRSVASGGAVLRLAHAAPGTAVEAPFETAVSGSYLVRVDGLRIPTGGNYGLELDGEPLPDWHGYAGERTRVAAESVRRAVTAGRHVLRATCIGRDEQSTGYDAELDSLVGSVD
jgi:hypothetical protein